MAIRIRNKSNELDDFDVAVNRVLQGGIISAIEVPLGSAVWVPIVVYDDAISISGDKLEVQTPKVISELYWAYDTTFVADIRINPVITGEAATPVLFIAAGNTSKTYTTPVTTASNALYSISLNNPNNYKVQFCSNVEGTGGTIGGTTGGYPANNTTAWVNIEPTGSFYLVRSLCSVSNDQTIYIRYERTGAYPSDGSYRLAPNFPKLAPYNNSGGVPTAGSAVVAYGANGGVLLLAHVWGMMGNDDPVNFQQGTYQDDICAIEEDAGYRADSINCLPWYAVRNGSSTEYQVTKYNENGNGADLGKRAKNLHYSFMLTLPIMRAYVIYAVEAGIQGFMMLNYANDTYLSLFRRLFRQLSNDDKKGIKICYSLNFGGPGRDTYDNDLATNTWNNGTVYRDTLREFALDIVDPGDWYATARKMVAGTRVYRPIVHCLIEDAGTMEADKATAWIDLQRIKARVLVNRPGNPLVDTFNVLMTSGPTISVGSADATGEIWNAKSDYYLQPELSAGFNDSGRILDINLEESNINSSVANKAPMISWGYYSGPRWRFKWKVPVEGFPYGPSSTANTVLNYMPTLINKLKTQMNNPNKDLRLAICGQVGEYAEQGRDLFPNIQNNRSMLDIFKDKFVTNR